MNSNPERRVQILEKIQNLPNKKNVHASQLVSSLSGQFSTQLAAHTKSILAFNHIGINVLSSNTVMPYL